jgi:hypothetical protein
MEMDKGKSPENNATMTSPNSNSNNSVAEIPGRAEEKREKQKKKPGFFARWKESTSKAYDAHRAAGGNL